MDLSANYEVLRRQFSRSALRNLKKAENSGITIQNLHLPDPIVDLHRKRFKDRIGTKAADYEKLLVWLHGIKDSNMLHCIGAFDNQDSLIAGSLFILYKDRITFLLNGNSTESLNNGATHALLNHCIQTFAGRPLLLDFEGSDFTEFARFYEQYGARPEYYPFVKLNRLPWWAAWMKK